MSDTIFNLMSFYDLSHTLGHRIVKSFCNYVDNLESRIVHFGLDENDEPPAFGYRYSTGLYIN